MRKVIKLINNERLNKKIVSAKAMDLCTDPTATDHCTEIDNAICSVGAVDFCVKDYAACTVNAVDYCPPERDLTGCYGSGETDY